MLDDQYDAVSDRKTPVTFTHSAYMDFWMRACAKEQEVSISTYCRAAVREKLHRDHGGSVMPHKVKVRWLPFLRAEQQRLHPDASTQRVDAQIVGTPEFNWELPHRCPECNAEEWQLMVYGSAETQIWECTECGAKGGDKV